MGDVDPSLSLVDFRTPSPSRSSLSLPHQVHSRLPFTVGGSPCPVEGMPHTVYSRTHGEVGHEQISSSIQRHSPFDPIQPQSPATTFTCYCIQSTIHRLHLIFIINHIFYQHPLQKSTHSHSFSTSIHVRIHWWWWWWHNQSSNRGLFHTPRVLHPDIEIHG